MVVGDWYHEENNDLVKNEFLTWVSFRPEPSSWCGSSADDCVAWFSRTLPVPNQYPVRLSLTRFRAVRTDPLHPLESALIYVAKNGKYMNTQAELSAGTGVNDEAVLPFEAGKKYRIRIINMSALSSTSACSCLA